MTVRQAVGMIETYGLLPAVEGLDACLKAANVELAGFAYVSAGLVMLTVTGDVGAVQAAVDAGATAAARVGRVVSKHVIPRPHESVGTLFPPPQRPGGRKGGTGIHRREFGARARGAASSPPEIPAMPEEVPGAELTLQEAPPPEVAIPLGEAVPQEEVALQEETVPQEETAPLALNPEALQARRIADLRKIALSIPGISLSREQIRSANKDALIEAILQAPPPGDAGAEGGGE